MKEKIVHKSIKVFELTRRLCDYGHPGRREVRVSHRWKNVTCKNCLRERDEK